MDTSGLNGKLLENTQHTSFPPLPSAYHPPSLTPEELADERSKIRRLQMVVNVVMQLIAQDRTLTVDDAAEMLADTRRAALGMFPDKDLTFNLIYWPRRSG